MQKYKKIYRYANYSLENALNAPSYHTLKQIKTKSKDTIKVDTKTFTNFVAERQQQT